MEQLPRTNERLKLARHRFGQRDFGGSRICCFKESGDASHNRGADTAGASGDENKVLRGADIGSSLNGPRAEATDELFLEQEKNRDHGHRHQEGSGHRASPVDSEHGRKFGQADRQGFGIVGVR